MSIANAQSTETDSHSASSRTASYDHDPEEVFAEVVQDDDTICQRCFRQQYAVVVVAVPTQTAESNADVLDWEAVADADTGDELVDVATLEQADGVETWYPPRVRDPEGDLDVPQAWKRATPPAKTVCECGAVDDDGSRAPLSTTKAVEHASRVSDRLHDRNVAHSRGLLLEMVERWKGVSAIASRDEEIFAHAVRVAVEKARGRRLRSVRITDDNALEIKAAD